MDSSDSIHLEKYRGYLRVLADMQLGPRLRAKEDVSDVVQITMMQAHKAANEFRGETEAELRAWLKKILRNTLLNLAKRHQAGKRDFRLERSIDQQLQGSASRIAGELSASKSSPSEHLIRMERAEQIADALATLLEDEFQAVTLKHIHGWTVAEIADELGRTPNGVAGLLRRALKKMRMSLQEVDSRD